MVELEVFYNKAKNDFEKRIDVYLAFYVAMFIIALRNGNVFSTFLITLFKIDDYKGLYNIVFFIIGALVSFYVCKWVVDSKGEKLADLKKYFWLGINAEEHIFEYNDTQIIFHKKDYDYGNTTYYTFDKSVYVIVHETDNLNEKLIDLMSFYYISEKNILEKK